MNLLQMIFIEKLIDNSTNNSNIFISFDCNSIAPTPSSYPPTFLPSDLPIATLSPTPAPIEKNEIPDTQVFVNFYNQNKDLMYQFLLDSLEKSVDSENMEYNYGFCGWSDDLKRETNVDIIVDNSDSDLELNDTYNYIAGVEFNNVLFIKNEGYNGGALAIEMTNNSNGNVFKFISNKAANGAGLYSNWGNVFLIDSIFNNNTAIKQGGGMRAYATGISCYRL